MLYTQLLSKYIINYILYNILCPLGPISKKRTGAKYKEKNIMFAKTDHDILSLISACTSKISHWKWKITKNNL